MSQTLAQLIKGVSLASAPAGALTVDSSGRLLVGTSTSLNGGGNQYSMVQVIGNHFGDTTPGYLALGRSEVVTSMSNNDPLGRITFTDNAAGDFARIEGVVDNNCGTDDYPGRLVFSTTADGASSPTERFRIASGGQPFFRSEFSGVTSAIANNAASGDAIFRGRHSATTINNGTLAFQVNADGDCENANNRYTGFSDIKLKENIQDAGSQWDDLKALRVRKYNFKEETGHQTHTQIGLVAQEVEPICPGLVSESIDRDDEGNDLGTVTKSVNYSVLYMKAVKALQEAMERIETLEAKVAALETP